jgi:protein O-GlcNAc transferase
MIDFRRLVNRTEPVMYDMDVLNSGEIGGYCRYNESLLQSQVERLSSLQSWAPELQHFKQLETRPLDKDSKICDRIVKTPTFIMKIDASKFLFVRLYYNAYNNFQ